MAFVIWFEFYKNGLERDNDWTDHYGVKWNEQESENLLYYGIHREREILSQLSSV